MTSDIPGQSPGLLRRIEELAARSGDEESDYQGPDFSGALSGLRAELGNLRADATRHSDELADQVLALTSSVNGLLDAMPELRQTLDAVPTRASGDVANDFRELSGQLTSAVESATEDLRRTLSSGMTQASAGSRAAEVAWSETRAALEERMAAIEDTLDGLAERLESLGRDSAGTAAARLDRLEERVTALLGAVNTEIAHAGDDRDRGRELAETQVAALESMGDTVSEALGDLGSAVSSGLTNLGGSLHEAMEVSSDEDREHLDARLTELDSSVATNLTNLTGSLAEVLEASSENAREQLQERLADFDTVFSTGLTELGGSLLESMETATEGDREHLQARLADLAEVIDGAIGDLEQQLASRPDSGAGLASVAEAISGMQTHVEERLESMRLAIDIGLTDAGVHVRDEVREALQSMGPAGQQDHSNLRDEIVDLRADLADALEDVRGRIVATVESSRDGVADAIAEQEENVETINRELRTAMLDRIEESNSQLLTGLDELRSGVAVTATSHEATAARVSALTDTLRDVERSVSDLQGEWRPRTDAAMAEARSGAEGVLADFRTEAEGVLADVRAAMRRVTGTIDEAVGLLHGGTDRLAGSGEALLAYLANRDQLLEQQRDQVLHEVLDAFAAGLSAKERRAMSGRVGEALDRRRDTRDAERWRKEKSDEPAVAIPAMPADLKKLTEPVIPTPADERAASVRADARAARSAARAEAEASPTPVKRVAKSVSAGVVPVKKSTTATKKATAAATPSPAAVRLRGAAKSVENVPASVKATARSTTKRTAKKTAAKPPEGG